MNSLIRVTLIAAAVVLLTITLASANGSHTYTRSTSAHSHQRSARSTAVHTLRYCTACARDSAGRIKRDPQARRDFRRAHPCPSTGRASGACPGYVIDHVTPLKRGGADRPSNMQWQTKADAKAKDRME